MDPEDKKEFMSRQSTMMSVQNSVTDMDIGGGSVDSRQSFFLHSC